jgi:DNA processing protein
MNDREACIILNLLSGIGAVRFNALCDRFGSPSGIFNASYNSLIKTSGVGESLADKIVHWQKNADLGKELNLIKKAGVEIITICDGNFPYQLKEIPDPPLCLYVRGEFDPILNNSIAVVGSRRITGYGREMAEFLVSGLVYSGWTVISGLAYGIDAVAHQTAVDANGTTIAVLGGGLARMHPQDHTVLARNIIEKGGAVISEFPMEMFPTRKTFPMRNRIISGLCSGVVVIEAGVKSGSLITANFALEQGRLVFAVPGRANSPQSKGCNKLIKDGAVLTENVDDIINEFEFLPGISNTKSNNYGESEENAESLSLENLNLSPDEYKVAASVELEEKNVDKISEETKIPVEKILVVLLKLEMKKIIKQLPGKRFKLKSGICRSSSVK